MDQIKEVLFTPVYGEFLVWQIICAVLLLIALVKIVRTLTRSKPVEHPYMGARTCGHCGWRGQVSKYSATCPACNQTFGTMD